MFESKQTRDSLVFVILKLAILSIICSCSTYRRIIGSCTPCAEIDKKKCAGHRSTPIYEQSSAPPLKAPRGLQGGPLQSESIHSSLDIFKGSGHQKSESVFREFILRLELLSANYITTHLKLLSYSFECL